MTARAIITEGFGSFGTIPDVVRMGFGSNAVAPVVVVVPSIVSSGVVKRRARVRRRDFSSQESYELALKAALADAQFTIKPLDDELVTVSGRKRQKKEAQKRAVPVDKSLNIDAETLRGELQFANEKAAADAEEMQLIQLFISIIEDDLDSMRS